MTHATTKPTPPLPKIDFVLSSLTETKAERRLQTIVAHRIWLIERGRDMCEAFRRENPIADLVPMTTSDESQPIRWQRRHGGRQIELSIYLLDAADDKAVYLVAEQARLEFNYTLSAVIAEHRRLQDWIMLDRAVRTVAQSKHSISTTDN